MKSSESNPPVKTKPREAEVGPEEEAFPEELMRLARPPKGITAEVKDGVLTIRRRWSGAGISLLGTVPFLLLFGYAVVICSETGILPIAFLFAIFALSCVIFVPFVVNSSIILVDQDSLSLTHGPVRTKIANGYDFDVQIQTATIAQVYVRERTFSFEDGKETRFLVKVLHHSGKSTTLLHRLESYEQAKFIEHRLEAFLGIANRRVFGEVED